MTLNFSRTASQCAEARLLWPYFTTHFFFENGRLRRKNTTLTHPAVPAGHALQELFRTIADDIEGDPYWDRTIRDMYSAHGRYRLRNALRVHEESRTRGHQCACGTACRYPEAPSDY